MAVYDQTGNYVADSLRKAGEVLGISHQTVKNNSEQRGEHFYLIRQPSSNPGRPLGSKTCDNGFKWKN